MPRPALRRGLPAFPSRSWHQRDSRYVVQWMVVDQDIGLERFPDSRFGQDLAWLPDGGHRAADHNRDAAAVGGSEVQVVRYRDDGQAGFRVQSLEDPEDID